MLSNTIKKLIFLVRNTRKLPINSQKIIKQDNQNNQNKNFNNENKNVKNKKSRNNISQQQQQQQSFSHHISPTLKKIQKRYNQSIKKQQQQQKDMMKSFDQLRKSMIQENDKRKAQKQQKMSQKKYQKQLDKLEIPKQMKNKILNKSDNKQNDFSVLGNQLANQKDKFIKNAQNTQLKVKKSRSIKSQQQARKIKQLYEKSLTVDPLQSQKLKQDILLNYISKNSKQKQIQLNLSSQWKKQLEEKKKQKEEEQLLINQKIRYQKLNYQLNKDANPEYNKNTKQLQNIPFSRSEFRKIQLLKPNKKLQISQDQIWRSKYPSELIQQAIQYKNNELKYFKNLIQGDKRDLWDQKRQQSMLKRSKEQLQYNKNNKEIIQKTKEEPNKDLGAVADLKQQQGLTRYQDLQYYKEKGLKQFKQMQSLKKSKNSYQNKLKQQGQIDQKKGDKLSQIFMDEFLDVGQGKLQKKQKYQKSTFGIYQNKLNQLSKKLTDLGFKHQYEDLALLNKEQLFAQKKIREQDQSYQQYLLKKDKKKKMKQQLKKVHKEKLRQDINYDYQIDPVKLQKLNPVDMQEGLKKLQEIKKLKQTQIVSDQFYKQKIHHTKTLKSMTQFINAYFYNQIQNPNNNISQKIEVGNIISNPKNTVLNVFWKWKTQYLKVMERYSFTEDDINKQKKTIQAKLTKQRNYISSKMTQYLGLRYGPDIRFYFDQQLQQTIETYNQIKKYKNQIVQISLDQYKQKGFIKTKQQQNQYRQKLLALAQNNLDDLNNQKKLISKKYQKKQRIQRKLELRKQEKQKKLKKKQAQNVVVNKKKSNQKEKDQKILDEIIGKKVEKKKQSIFQSSMSQKQLDKLFGNDLNGNENIIPKKNKKNSVQKMWDQINKL